MPKEPESRQQPPTLTPEGRRRLEDKSRVLLERLSRFSIPRFGEPPDPAAARAYESLLHDFVELSRMIHSSESVDDLTDDPDVVLIGDEVVIVSGPGQVHQYVIVDPLEAAVDSGRLSSDSALGAALIGRSVGDRVSVEGWETPITILRASRRRLEG